MPPPTLPAPLADLLARCEAYLNHDTFQELTAAVGAQQAENEKLKRQVAQLHERWRAENDKVRMLAGGW